VMRFVALGMAAVALAPGFAVAQAAGPEQARVAVVNQDRVLNESEEGKRLKGELEKLRNAKAASIETKEKEIKALQEQAVSAQLSLSDEKRDEIARQLKRKRVEYERLNDDASAEFQDAANKAQARLIAMFREMIAKYGIEKGYTVILEKGTLYFATPTVDITEEVLARFNEVTKTAAAAPAPKK
jgi:outer membrane protein